MNTNELGKRIKEARIAKKMTQSEVVGSFITRNMLSQIENGTATPSVKTLTYLSKTLEIPLDQLLPDAEENRLASETGFLYNTEKDRSLSKIISLYLQGKQQYMAGDYSKALCTLETCLTEMNNRITDNSSVTEPILDDEIAALFALISYQSAFFLGKNESAQNDAVQLADAIEDAKKAIQYSSRGIFANTELKTKAMLLLEELLNRRLSQ